MSPSFLDFFLEDLTFNGAVYALFVVPAFVVCWGLLPRRLHGRRIQQQQRATARHVLHDAAFSVAALLVFSVIDYLVDRLDRANVIHIAPTIDELGVPWFLVSVALMIVLHDAYFYWTHRLMHHPRLYRSFHAVHHRSTDPSPLTSFAFHPLEAVVENGITVIFVFVMPVSFQALVAWQVFQQLFNMIGHLGYEVYPSWWLKVPVLNWKTVSTHHNLHHQRFSGNYGLYFTWWDRWMGTELPEYARRFEQLHQGVAPAPAGGLRST